MVIAFIVLHDLQICLPLITFAGVTCKLSYVKPANSDEDPFVFTFIAATVIRDIPEIFQNIRKNDVRHTLLFVRTALKYFYVLYAFQKCIF